MNELLPSEVPPLLHPPNAPSKPPKTLRWAATLNFVLPGAGLFYLGQRKLGAILAITFLICLAAALSVFLVGYVHYFNVVLSGDLLKEGQLEHLQEVFHNRWLSGLSVAGLVLQILSMSALVWARKDQAKLP